MEVTLNNSTLSRCLSKKLDELGFNQTEKWERILHYNRRSVVKHIALRLSVKSNNSHEFVGSLMEGIGLTIMNDLDTLQIDNRVICCRGKISESTRKLQRLTLQIDTNKVPAGYCLLKVVNPIHCSPDIFKIFEYAFVKQGKEKNVYLSSKLFLTKNDDDMIKLSKYIRHSMGRLLNKIHGPSQPRDNLGVILKIIALELFSYGSVDFVRCFPCNDKNIIRRWATRTRSFQWPNKKMIEHVLNLPVYVVPVGKNGSCNEHLQWRLSFVRAETYLIQMLNGTQTKCLVLLKFIVKYYLQPVCEGIDSYIVKNIVLWLAEETSSNKFRQKHLMARLEDGLRKLRRAIEKKSLRSYMLPEKNLLSGKLTNSQQNDLLIKLDFLLSRGHRLVTIYLFEPSFVMDEYSNLFFNFNTLHTWMRLDTKFEAMYSSDSLLKAFTSTHQLTSYVERLVFIYSGIPRFLYTYYWNANCLDVQQTVQTNVQEGFKLRKMIEEDDKKINEYEMNKSWREHMFSLLFETPALTTYDVENDDELAFKYMFFRLPYSGIKIMAFVLLLFIVLQIYTFSEITEYSLCYYFFLLFVFIILGERIVDICMVISVVKMIKENVSVLIYWPDNATSIDMSVNLIQNYLFFLHIVVLSKVLNMFNVPFIFFICFLDVLLFLFWLFGMT